MTTEDTMDDELARILENHNKQVADEKRGYPIGTQNYFTVNRIKNLLAPEANKAVLKALREDRLANAEFWKDKIDRMFGGEIATYKNALTAKKEQAVDKPKLDIEPLPDDDNLWDSESR